MQRQIFGTLRFTTNRALLVDGDIPRNFSSGISGDIELLFGIGHIPGAKAPSQFLRLELPSDENAPGLSAVEGEVITVLGDLTKMSVFDTIGIETQDPLLLVRTFARHKAIAVRAFEISQSNRSDTPEVNWLRAEQELLGSSKARAPFSQPQQGNGN